MSAERPYSFFFASLRTAFRRARENPPQMNARIPIIVTHVAVVIVVTSRSGERP